MDPWIVTESEIEENLLAINIRDRVNTTLLKIVFNTATLIVLQVFSDAADKTPTLVLAGSFASKRKPFFYLINLNDNPLVNCEGILGMLPAAANDPFATGDLVQLIFRQPFPVPLAYAKQDCWFLNLDYWAFYVFILIIIHGLPFSSTF